MRGRLQKSRRLKILTGDKDVNEGIIAQKLKEFPCPSWMPAFGKEFWDKIAPSLLHGGILTELDRQSFEGLALSYCLMRQAGLQLVEEGFTVKSERGTIKKHPTFSVYKANAELFLKFSEVFGLSPRARELLGLHIPSKEEDDNDLEDLLSR